MPLQCVRGSWGLIMKRTDMGSVYVSEIQIYMYTLPLKKHNFPEVAFVGGGVQVSEL